MDQRAKPRIGMERFEIDVHPRAGGGEGRQAGRDAFERLERMEGVAAQRVEAGDVVPRERERISELTCRRSTTS